MLLRAPRVTHVHSSIPSRVVTVEPATGGFKLVQLIVGIQGEYMSSAKTFLVRQLTVFIAHIPLPRIEKKNVLTKLHCNGMRFIYVLCGPERERILLKVTQ